MLIFSFAPHPNHLRAFPLSQRVGPQETEMLQSYAFESSWSDGPVWFGSRGPRRQWWFFL